MPTSKLVYAIDTAPGYRRQRHGDSFRYVDQNGTAVMAADRERIDALAIPPAWQDVWINPDENGHIQATGRDDRRRKQYIYHADWRAWRDQSKFEHIVDFASRLPRLRRRVARDLRRRTLSLDVVCAAAVRVLEETLIRVGNDEYANNNQTFGLTTLRRRHLKRRNGRMLFEFVGKHGKPFTAHLSNRRVRTILTRLGDLPGQHLFQYLDGSGETHRVRSDEINAYIREAIGGDFTAKDFRTWSATVLAAEFATGLSPTDEVLKKDVAEIVRSVARRLGNTSAVCRKSYIHPAILQACLDRDPAMLGNGHAALTGLSAVETRVLKFLRRQMRSAKKPLKVKLVELVQLAA